MACAAGKLSVETAVKIGPMVTFLSPVLRLDPWFDAAVGAPAAVVSAPARAELLMACCSSVALGGSCAAPRGVCKHYKGYNEQVSGVHM
jgi:hypothetical protein